MGVMGVPGQGWCGGPSWEALRVKQVGAQREGLDRSLKLLWRGGAHLKASSRSPVSPLLSPALTHQPHLRSPGALEPGRPGNLTCSVPWACERATPPIFSWTSAAPSSLGPRTPFSSVLTLTPRPQDHGTTNILYLKISAFF